MIILIDACLILVEVDGLITTGNCKNQLHAVWRINEVEN